MSLPDAALSAAGINQLQQGANMRKAEKRPQTFRLTSLAGGEGRDPVNAILAQVQAPGLCWAPALPAGTTA